MQLRNPDMTGYEGDEAFFAIVGNKRMPPGEGVQKEAGKAVQVTITIDNRDNCGLTRVGLKYSMLSDFNSL